MIIQTPWRHKISIIKSDSRSLTIPDDTMPIREIVKRFSLGLGVTGQKVAFYDESEDGIVDEMPDLRKLDLSEIAELKEQNLKTIGDIQNNLQKANKITADKQLREAVKKELAALSAASDKNTKPPVPDPAKQG